MRTNRIIILRNLFLIASVLLFGQQAVIAQEKGTPVPKYDENNEYIGTECQSSDKCECTGDESSEGSLGCAWIKMNMGNMRPTSTIKPGFLQIREGQPSPALSTPSVLRFVAGYGIHSVDTRNQRKMIVVDEQGRSIWLSFPANSSIAAPSAGPYESFSVRVMMVDAENWATTNDPAYYDLYPGNGEIYRFGAHSGSDDYLQMIYHKTAFGRTETFQDMGTEIIRGEDFVLKQVMTPSRLADVVIENNFVYKINMYRSEDVQSLKNPEGLFIPKIGISPIEYWIVENPETNSFDKLQLLHVRGASTNIFEYAYTASSHEWSLVKGGGLWKETLDYVYDDSMKNRLLTRTTFDTSDNVMKRETTKFHVFPWGESITEVTQDPDGASLKKEISYYENSAEPWRYGQRSLEKYRDGSWEKMDYGSNGLISVKYTPFKDSESTATNIEARAEYYDYTPHVAEDSIGYNDQRPRTVTGKVLGITVSKIFYTYVTNAVRELQEIEEKCADPNAAYGLAGNLRTTKTYFGTNVANHLIGRLKSVEYTDGRLDTYNYEYGTLPVTWTNAAEYAFTPNENGDAWRQTITHGTTTSPDGIAGKTTREVKVLDGYSQEVLKETYVCSGGASYERISWAVQKFNDFYKPIETYHSNGAFEEATWAACGCKKQSEKDAAGIEKTYDLDLLNRVITATKKGVNAPSDDLTSQYTYDAAGRQLTETMVGGFESNSISMLVSSNAFDIVGRLTSSANSLNLSTSYSYQNGGRISTVIQPGGVTNITENYLDGRPKCTRQNGVIKTWNDYGVNPDSTRWTITYIGPTGTNSPMWSKTTTDHLGRTICEEKPGFGGMILTNSYSFNSKGYLSSSTSISGTTLYEYNELGEQVRRGLDINTNGVLDLAGPDRIFESETYYEYLTTNNWPAGHSLGDGWWRTSVSRLYVHDNSVVVSTNSIQKTKLTGLGSGGVVSLAVSSDMLGNQTTASTIIDRNSKTVTQSTTYPDSTNAAVSVTINGLLVSSISKTGLRNDFGYDFLERRIAVIDPRTGTFMTHYNDKGQVDWTQDAASNITSYVYTPDAGRRISVTDAMSNTTYTAYNLDGQVIGVFGATYPVLYDFDEFNRMSAMYTLRNTNVVASDYSGFRSQISSFDKTSWTYDQATGLLTNKLYADTNGVSYTYAPDGRLLTRTWARGVITAYSYTNSGELVGTTYSDSTPAVAFVLNRIGQQKTITDGQGTRTFTYNDALQLASETNVLGLITRNYDGLGRSTGFSFGLDYSVTYGFGGDGRFNSVSSSVQSVSSVVNYSYLPGSDLIAGWSNDVTQVSRIYEPNRNLITQVKNMSGSFFISQFDYINDQLGRRTQRVDALAVTNSFGYNLRSELVAASMDTNSYNYFYDSIGNRTAATNNAEAISYAANALNQYTNISGTATVAPLYDLDGNITNYGVFAYSWDAENRLISIASNNTVIASYRYDYMSRRVEKAINGVTNTFAYNGWAMIQESSSVGVTNTYVYGLDLSGSLQGAGTIGGLLSAAFGGASSSSIVFYCFDANGNVTDLAGSDGNVVGHYEFDPYGNTTVKAGVLACVNPYRFSTKYTDSETGMLYYGHRYYQPETGMWLSRDPLGEYGFKMIASELINLRNRFRSNGQLNDSDNLYGFVYNSPITTYDSLGLFCIPSLGNPAQTSVPCAGNSQAWVTGPWVVVLDASTTILNQQCGCATLSQTRLMNNSRVRDVSYDLYSCFSWGISWTEKRNWVISPTCHPSVDGMSMQHRGRLTCFNQIIYTTEWEGYFH